MPRKPRPENLKSWKKGQSGNPKGRPKSKFFTEELKRQLETLDPNGQTALERIVASWIQKAEAGSFPHLGAALDRLDGRVSEAKTETPAGSTLAASIGALLTRHQRGTTKPKAKAKAKAKPKAQAQPKRKAKAGRKAGPA